jgi:hypothetical protein
MGDRIGADKSAGRRATTRSWITTAGCSCRRRTPIRGAMRRRIRKRSLVRRWRGRRTLGGTSRRRWTVGVGCGLAKKRSAKSGGEAHGERRGRRCALRVWPALPIGGRVASARGGGWCGASGHPSSFSWLYGPQEGRQEQQRPQGLMARSNVRLRRWLRRSRHRRSGQPHTRKERQRTDGAAATPAARSHRPRGRLAFPSEPWVAV